MILQHLKDDLPLCEDTFEKAFWRGIEGATIVEHQRRTSKQRPDGYIPQCPANLGHKLQSATLCGHR